MPATSTRPRGRAHDLVRVRAVPPLDPPYDDELPRDPWSQLTGPAQLTLDLTGIRRAPTRRPRPAPPPLPVPRRGTGHPTEPSAAVGQSAGAATPGGGGPHPAPAGTTGMASPEARQAARRFLGTCLEVFNGYRPNSHLRRLCTPIEAEAMIDRLAAATRRLAHPRTPVRQRAPEAVRPRLLRVSEPTPGIAEAAAVLGRSGRVWAMAYRLELRRGVWLGTAADLI